MIDLEGSVYAQRHQQGVEGCCKTAEDLARYRQIIRTMRPDGILECLPGDALVTVPAGRTVRAIRRTYSGPMIEIATSGGHKLAATPNHPVLTRRGWVPAGSVKEGDYVVSGAGLERMGVGNPDVDDVPAPIGEIFDTLKRRAAERGPFCPVNLNVGAVCRQIEVVSTDGPLPDDRVAAVGYPSGQHRFALADLGAVTFPGPGTGCQRRLCDRRRMVPDAGQVRFCPLPVGLPAEPGQTGFGLGARQRPRLDRRRADSRTAYSVLGSDDLWALARGVAAADLYSIERDARRTEGNTRVADRVTDLVGGYTHAFGDGGDLFAGRIAGQDFVPVVRDGRPSWAHEAEGSDDRVDPRAWDAESLADRAECLSSGVHADYVVGVERTTFNGHVYNLQTSTGWYEANGIIVHNCGSYSGKSALWLAREAGCEVMSVDISDLPTKDPDVMAEAARLGVTFVTLTRTTSQQALEQAVYWSVGRSRILVSLDSDHSAATVLGEMEMYHRFVPVGGYMVVEDGIIRWVPEQLPYYQDSSPLDAIEQWLPSHPNWEQDMSLEDCYPITNFPGGFLRRIR